MVVKHLHIFGMVQGVGYRYSMFYAAQNLGVTGWVRNCTDGSVEAMVEGPPEKVEEFIKWAGQGPSLCAVKKVDVADGAGHFEAFEIKHTI
jgi:acylphosphatase